MMNNKIEQLIGQHDIILFDAECVLCSAWANFMVQHDHHIQFKLASVQSDLGQQLLKKFQLPTDHFETMVLIEDRKLYTESSAFLRIIRRLDFPYSALQYTRFIPSIIRDFAYRRIALNRYTLFGKMQNCYVITPEIQQHFLMDEV